MGRDGYTGLAVLAASLFLFASTLGLERHPMVPIGPGFYPRLVLGITAAMALLLVVLDVAAHRRARGRVLAAEAAASPPNYRLVLLAFAIFAAYVFVLPGLGFRIATFAFVVAMQATLEPPRGARRWALVIAVAAATALATYLAFESYLQVLLPRGRWTDF